MILRGRAEAPREEHRQPPEGVLAPGDADRAASHHGRQPALPPRHSGSIYIYIYIERERDIHICVCIYIYIYICV